MKIISKSEFVRQWKISDAIFPRNTPDRSTGLIHENLGNSLATGRQTAARTAQCWPKPCSARRRVRGGLGLYTRKFIRLYPHIHHSHSLFLCLCLCLARLIGNIIQDICIRPSYRDRIFIFAWYLVESFILKLYDNKGGITFGDFFSSFCFYVLPWFVFPRIF